MSALIDALAKEQNKLERQLANLAATKEAMAVIGETPRELNKIARQEKAIEDTRANIKKLSSAVNKLK